jgi:hypothetical protein
MIGIRIGYLGLFLAALMCQAQEGNWHPLFNGRDIDQWIKTGGEAVYFVENGELVGTTRPNTPNTFLCPPTLFRDFILEFEVKCHPDLNSGCQIRSAFRIEDLPESLIARLKDRPRARKGVERGLMIGPQIEIAANGNAGAVYFERYGGWILNPRPEVAEQAYLQDGWNRYRIKAKGNRIQVWINNVLITDDLEKESGMDIGYFGFQVHGVGDRKGPLEVRWRNIRVLPLN